ncbi:MAG TPA: hypothetical protein DCY48_02900 [Candidatus Magasanikbacteria bacterium]|nr:hypothetical protein [Candidatus Magasanikbacteria bacterium]
MDLRYIIGRQYTILDNEEQALYTALFYRKTKTFMPKIAARMIHRVIHEANKILLIPHQHPDGDTLGSLSACMGFLRAIGKPHEAYCRTAIPDAYAFLPHVDRIATEENTGVWRDPAIDVIIVFDAGDLHYAGVDDYIKRMEQRPIIVNIDHHATNEHFGHHNLVIPTASSTTEILYRFFIFNHIPIDEYMATALLTGLITDTDHFTNAATSSASLKFAGDLIKRGANLHRIRLSSLKNKTVGGLKVWGVVLSRLETDKETDTVYTYITREDTVRHDVSEEEIEGVANFMNVLGEGRASLILKERENGQVKGSFRTTKDDVDVSLYAKALGGGGHKKAAGFLIDGPIETAAKRVLGSMKHGPS